MGLLQKALETYDAHIAIVGKVEAGHQPLAPIGHLLTKANIEITVDADGNMADAREIGKDEDKIIIPVTEDSAGRSRAPAAHALCDQLGYLSGEDEEKFNLYLEQLQNWESSPYSHPMLKPILTYVRKRTILTDLTSRGINASDEKQLVRWRVVGIGHESGPCWTNLGLFRSYTDWYRSIRVQDEKNNPSNLCMITGKVSVPAKQHPKGIVPINGNAKLISANDTENFTFRGRFTNASQAATISYEASQKAHNALRWLVAEQGAQVIFGGRTFLCWNPQGKEVPRAHLPFLKASSACITPTDYRSELLATLSGWRTKLPEASGIVIAAFDAATTGRLALTYYNELLASDFLQRLYDWDITCCWYGRNSGGAVQSPALWQIINCAFGVQRTEKGGKAKLETDGNIMRQQMQRLISCRVDRALFPADIEQALVNRASTPQSYEPEVYSSLLVTACAVIRKYHHDHTMEELSMELEKERFDRSYQFGRLLAVLEKAERDTYSFDDGREPNAIRLQSAYSQHPLHTANLVEAQLERAYFPRLQPGIRIFYKRLIGEIIENIHSISQSEAELNRPLGDTYLIGYYLQRNELYKAKKQNTQNESQMQEED